MSKHENPVKNHGFGWFWSMFRLETGRSGVRAFTIKVTEGLREATIAAAVSTQGLPHVQSCGGRGLGGPLGGSRDLSGYLNVRFDPLSSLFRPFLAYLSLGSTQNTRQEASDSGTPGSWDNRYRRTA